MTDPTPNHEPSETGFASANPHLVTLSNGIVLRTKPVNAWVQRRLAQSVPLPVPPMAAGPADTEEENPDDPDYLDAMSDAVNERLRVVNEGLIVLGTQVETCPDDIAPPESDAWLDDLRAVGIAIDPAPSERYREWLQLVALSLPQDTNRLIAAIFARSGGVLEEEVAVAVRWFRSRTLRDADRGGTAPAGNPNGDHVQPAIAGDGPRVRAQKRRAG